MKWNLDIEPSAIFSPCGKIVSGCYLILDLNIKGLQETSVLKTGEEAAIPPDIVIVAYLKTEDFGFCFKLNHSKSVGSVSKLMCLVASSG